MIRHAAPGVRGSSNNGNRFSRGVGGESRTNRDDGENFHRMTNAGKNCNSSAECFFVTVHNIFYFLLIVTTVSHVRIGVFLMHVMNLSENAVGVDRE
jgi:hypothetical protein